jgi:hypothetical protein
LGVLGLHGSAAAVLGQTPAQLPGEAAEWLNWVIGAGVVVVVVLAAFLNPKRSHLT